MRSEAPKLYNGGMARGWDSKSIEAQIEEKNSATVNQTIQSLASQEEVHSKIRRNNLLLSRRRIEQELAASGNERYSEMLRRSLAELDSQLEAAS